MVKSLIPPKDTSEVEFNAVKVQTVPNHLEKVGLAADKECLTETTKKIIKNNGAAKSILVLLKRSSTLSKVLSS